MKNYEEITETEYRMIIAMAIISIPLVIDAIIRMAELSAMIGG